MFIFTEKLNAFKDFFYVSLYLFLFCTDVFRLVFAQSAGAVEYTDCFSAEW